LTYILIVVGQQDQNKGEIEVINTNYYPDLLDLEGEDEEEYVKNAMDLTRWYHGPWAGKVQIEMGCFRKQSLYVQY
jgi:hypothetical protein